MHKKLNFLHKNSIFCRKTSFYVKKRIENVIFCIKKTNIF